jgi:hypothetical protein
MNESAPRPPESGAPSNESKKPYVAPILVCYGKVATLTQGGSCNTSNDNGSSTCTAGGSMAGVWASDRSIKSDLTRVGEHPMGFGLYLFHYKPEYQAQWGAGRRFGVMADEVEKVRPDAVHLHRDGYKVVSYPLLGIEIQT